MIRSMILFYKRHSNCNLHFQSTTAYYFFCKVCRNINPQNVFPLFQLRKSVQILTRSKLRNVIRRKDFDSYIHLLPPKQLPESKILSFLSMSKCREVFGHVFLSYMQPTFVMRFSQKDFFITLCLSRDKDTNTTFIVVLNRTHSLLLTISKNNAFLFEHKQKMTLPILQK